MQQMQQAEPVVDGGEDPDLQYHPQQAVPLESGPKRRREAWILTPVMTTQQALSTTYIKFKLQYTSHDCLYSKELAKLGSPPHVPQGCVINVHEDRVEEELKLIMDLDQLLPDGELIALVQGMISSLKAWVTQFKSLAKPVRSKKLDITGTWLDKEIEERRQLEGKPPGRHPHDDDNLFRGRKAYRRRELKQQAKHAQIRELSQLRPAHSDKPALTPKQIADFLKVKVTEVYRLRAGRPAPTRSPIIPMSKDPVYLGAIQSVVREIGLQ